MSPKEAVHKMMNGLNRMLKYIEMTLVAGSVIVMTVDLAGNFISRNLFNYSWTFAEEVGSFTLIVLTFAGTAYCARMGRHIRMSALFDQLPFKAKKVLAMVICLVTAVIMFYLCKLGIDWVVKTYISNKVSSVLRVPMYLIYCIIPFGFLMAGLQYCNTLIKNILDKEHVWVGTEATDYEAE